MRVNGHRIGRSLPVLVLLLVGACGLARGDVAGFDDTLDNDFWKTTGRVDVPPASLSSQPAGGAFVVPGRDLASAEDGETFVAPGFLREASRPLDRRFSTKPFALVLVIR